MRGGVPQNMGAAGRLRSTPNPGHQPPLSPHTCFSPDVATKTLKNASPHPRDTRFAHSC